MGDGTEYLVRPMSRPPADPPPRQRRGLAAELDLDVAVHVRTAQ